MSHPITRQPVAAAFRLGSVLLVAALVAVAAAGCSAPREGSEATLELQSHVLAVSEAAAANDDARSLQLIDELSAALDRAMAAGDISFQRYQSIVDTIEALRTELTVRTPVNAETAPAAAPNPLAATSGGAMDQPAAAAPAVMPPAAEAPAPAVQAPGPPAPAAGTAPAIQAPLVMTPSPAPHTKGKALGKLQGKGNGKG